jgi:low temperature requirement protein LtrA
VVAKCPNNLEVLTVRTAGRGSVLRASDGGERRVTPLELFFDLVYVFAITQLSHLLLDHLTVGGALQTLFLLLASLVMSVAIPEAFGERGLMFALSYVAIQVGRTGFAVVALAGSSGASDQTSRDLAMTYRRILRSCS